MGAKLSKTREEFEKTVPPFMLVDARRAVEMLRSNPQEVVTRPTTLATSMKKGVRYVLEKDNAFSYAQTIAGSMCHSIHFDHSRWKVDSCQKTLLGCPWEMQECRKSKWRG